MSELKWPYAVEFGQEETVESDVLVLGGGLAGCFAAIAAARRGQKVVVVEKGATKRSGSAGTGFDHWESACTNPCSKVTAKEIADDLENPKRDIPLTLIIAPALVCVIYILMGVVTLGNMPDGALTDLATVGQTYLGRGLLTFFIVGGPLCGIMTSIIPVMMLSCAMIQTSAEHGVFPEVVARKNKNGVSTIVLIYVIALTEFLVLSGKGTGELMVMFSFVNTACAVPTCLVPFYLKKRYPNSCDYAGLKIPYKLVVTLSGFALVVSVYLAITMLIGLDTSSWVLILIMVAVTILYFFVRVAYIKSHGGNLLADLRAPYQPWEEQEAKCKAMNEAKAK